MSKKKLATCRCCGEKYEPYPVAVDQTICDDCFLEDEGMDEEDMGDDAYYEDELEEEIEEEDDWDLEEIDDVGKDKE